MAITASVLIPSKAAETAQTTQYTSTNCKTRVEKFTATNTGASTATISINLIPSGNTASASNLIVSAKAIAPGETYIFPEIVGHTLNVGEYISTITSATSTITIKASGILIT